MIANIKYIKCTISILTLLEVKHPDLAKCWKSGSCPDLSEINPPAMITDLSIVLHS